MANCHSLFQIFHSEICINKDKKDKMMTSKNALRNRIRKWFKENQPAYEPKFYIQGSYKTKSGIRTEEDVCDLDDGVYFFRQPDETATTLQTWVWKAVNGYTSVEAEHRQKCVRTTFVRDYEIDHPVYYKVDGEDYQIAIKNTGWRKDDPKAMVDWFVQRKDKEGRLTRQVMFLKGWCDHMTFKMPNGLAMTILAANAKEKIVLNERDDITLKDILNEIKKSLDGNFECVVPVIPSDDLFADYDQTRKDKFLTALSDFLDDAQKALQEENHLKASKLWRKHLGDRLPLGEDKKEESKSTSATAVGALTSNPWACE